MASVNKVILVGNLGADPEVRYLPSGDAVANIRLATTDRYKDKTSGEMKEATEWHRVSFFGRLAEIVNEYVKKGSSIYIEGRIRTRKGAAVGVYNTTQSIGLALGGVVGGWLLKVDGASVVFYACSALVFCWLIIAANMQPPPRRA